MQLQPHCNPHKARALPPSPPVPKLPPELPPNRQGMVGVVNSPSESSSGNCRNKRTKLEMLQGHIWAAAAAAAAGIALAKLFLRCSCRVKGAAQLLVQPRLRASSSQPPPQAGESPQGLTEQRRVRKNRGGGMQRGRGRERNTSAVIYNKSHPGTRSVPGDVPGASSGCHTQRGSPAPGRGTGLLCPLVTLEGGSPGSS